MSADKMESVLKKNIAAAMKERGIKLAALARLCGVPYRTLQDIVDEKSTARISTVGAIAAGLGMRPGDLLNNSNDIDPKQALAVLAKAINQPKAVEKPVIEIPPDQVPLVREFLDAMKDHFAAENLKLALENHKSAQDAIKRAKRHYSDDDGSSSSTG